MNKKIILPTAFVLGVIMIGLLSVSYVSAQDSSDYPPIVQMLAEKFNLNESDVQAVFDEEREDHHAQMQASWSERLDDLVNEGKITSDQKQAIMDKHEEMHNKMLEIQSLEPEERHEKMRQIHDEFKTWAEEQGIDLPLLGPMGGGLKRGFHKGYMMGAN
jgi:aryl-alcohol dehydrogenase-like predicted oxidoreductase